MENFIFEVPTKIYFGKGQITNLAQEISQCGKTVLLVYFGDSIKTLGIYDSLTKMFSDNGIKMIEFVDLESNPHVESVNKGAEICIKNKVDAILAVGGGSVIDCCKMIAATAKYGSNAWDLVKDKSKIKEVLPLFTILTLAATGSEMDSSAVISNMESMEKLNVMHALLTPKCSILDPTYTFSVPSFQSSSGTADILSHVLEVYFNNGDGTFMVDRMAEGLMKTCIKYGPVVLKDPTNYEARANLMWSSSWAINGLLSSGKTSAWSSHNIQHPLGAFYNITHGAGLAIILPHWMRYILSEKSVSKFVEYGVNVWGIDCNKDPFEIAREAIEKTALFFKELNLPATLSEYGIGREHFEEMAEKAVAGGLARAYVPLDKNDVIKIYEACLS